MIANGRRRWKIKNIIEGPAVLDKTHTPSSKMSENGVEYNVNLLLQYVKGEEFNVEENSYIKRVIKYVLEKLNEESKKKMDCFVNSVSFILLHRDFAGCSFFTQKFLMGLRICSR